MHITNSSAHGSKTMCGVDADEHVKSGGEVLHIDFMLMSLEANSVAKLLETREAIGERFCPKCRANALAWRLTEKKR